MNGYMIHHETAINNNAAKAASLASEYDRLINDLEAESFISGWDSPAADSQRAELKEIIARARAAAQALRQVSSAMYDFTASHKTWLEDVVDFVTGEDSTAASGDGFSGGGSGGGRF